jgi:hypothetical protein
MELHGLPTCARSAHGALWIGTQNSWLYRDGVVYLDLRSRLPPLSSSYDERGLLGIAVHPLSS